MISKNFDSFAGIFQDESALSHSFGIDSKASQDVPIIPISLDSLAQQIHPPSAAETLSLEDLYFESLEDALEDESLLALLREPMGWLADSDTSRIALSTAANVESVIVPSPFSAPCAVLPAAVSHETISDDTVNPSAISTNPNKSKGKKNTISRSSGVENAATAPVVEAPHTTVVVSNPRTEKEKQKTTSRASVNVSKSNRGNYRCGRCGEPKVNHVCAFVTCGKVACQTSFESLNPFTGEFVEIERIVVVGAKRPLETQKKNEAEEVPLPATHTPPESECAALRVAALCCSDDELNGIANKGPSSPGCEETKE